MNYLSVCSGIEAATMAWHPLGWRAVAFAEIEPFPCAVLAHRYNASRPWHMPRPQTPEERLAIVAENTPWASWAIMETLRLENLPREAAIRAVADLPDPETADVPNLGDLTRYEEWPLELLAEVDVLVGGTPCQAFSVAGARQSLADHRGNLTLIYANLLDRIDHARDLHGRPPALCLWENVPGVLNTPDNALGCFLGRLAGEDGPLRPPGGRWTDAGYVRGPARAIAWRCLDAQYFGLAQRRDRVFLVASAGAVRVEEILFELEGLRRDSPPSRGTGERVAGTLANRSGGGGGLGTDFELGGGLIPEITPPVTGTPYGDNSSREGLLVAEVGGRRSEIRGQRSDVSKEQASSPVCMATGQASAEIGIGIGTTLNCNHEAPIVAFSARERGDDGRGYDRAPQVFGEAVGALDTVKPHCVAYEMGSHEATKAPREEGQVEEPTLLGGAFAIQAGALKENPTHGPDGVGVRDDDCAYTLEARAEVQAVAFETRFVRNGRGAPDEIVAPLKAESGTNGKGDGAPCVATGMAVRRLTPRECERLQGFPDDFTLIPYRGKEAADGPRYKALGNSKAVPVVRWIGRRIAAAFDAVQL